MNMTVAVRSFAKINLGLYIGPRRDDGFHELRTVYQTIALHDVIRVSVASRNPARSGKDQEHDSRRDGTQIEIRCKDSRVPLDASNTCHRVAALVMQTLGARGKVSIEIEKKLPVQGGLGAASSNAVATMLGLEKALRTRGLADRRAARRGKPRLYSEGLTAAQRLQIAAQVGSDLPLFLIGGTVLGLSRGEEVYPLPDLPSLPMVVVTPEIGVSTPKAFAVWDALAERDSAGLHPPGRAAMPVSTQPNPLTQPAASDRLSEVGRALSAWLGGYPDAGAPADFKGGGRAGSLLSDLVRAGIRNDFEQVVFSQFPELRDMKRALERAGSRYASLSGSGSSLYGLFGSDGDARKAASRLRKQGIKAVATRTLARGEYWKKVNR
jgi:4-diphosphocytidyl-2-C-methyl-D-erythritol kinase